MGKLITFWSPYIGKAKVTASMCAVAGAMGLLYPELEIALSHAPAEDTELEGYLDNRRRLSRKKELYEKTGLAALQLNYMQAVLTSEKIRRCAIPLNMKSIYLFPGSGKNEELDEIQFRLLTEKLVQEFEATFLELKSGKSEISEKLMQEADLNVVVLPQNPVYWETFLEETKWQEGKRFCLLLGGYMMSSKYSLNYFKRKIGIRNKEIFLGVVPLNTGYMDAVAEGRGLDFFLKNELPEKKEENYEFISQTKRIAKYFKTEVLFS